MTPPMTPQRTPSSPEPVKRNLFGTPEPATPGSPQPQSTPYTQGSPPNSPHKAPKAEFDGTKYRKEVNHNEAKITSIILRYPNITPNGYIQTESEKLVLYSEPFGESIYNKFRDDNYNNIFRMNLFPKINQALWSISRMGIMLCDIAPANTLVNKDNDIRLIDFEFAHNHNDFIQYQKMVYSIMLATALHTLTVGDASKIYPDTTNTYEEEYNAVMKLMNTFLESINKDRINEKYRTTYFEYVEIYSFELDEVEFKRMVFNIYTQFDKK